MNVLIKNLPKNKTSVKLLVGFATTFNYAVYPALIWVFALSGQRNDLKESIALGFSIVAGKELFTFLIYACVSNPLQLFKDIKQLFTKAGCVIAFGGLFGGPIGYSFQTIGAIYVGGALAAMLSSSSIIFIFLFENFFIKRRHTKTNALGVFIAAFSVIMIGFFAASSKNWAIDNKKIIGMCFALLASLSWAFESTFMDVGLRLGKNQFNSNSALRLRLFFSAIVLLFFIWPIVISSLGQWKYGSSYFVGFFTNLKMFLQIFAVGFFLFLARLFFLKSIKMQGATIGFIWYTLSVLVTPFIIVILYEFGVGTHPADITTIKSWWFWVFGLTMLIGIFLINLTYKDKPNSSKVDIKFN